MLQGYLLIDWKPYTEEKRCTITKTDWLLQWGSEKARASAETHVFNSGWHSQLHSWNNSVRWWFPLGENNKPKRHFPPKITASYNVHKRKLVHIEERKIIERGISEFPLESEQTPTRVRYKRFNEEQLKKQTLDSCRDRVQNTKLLKAKKKIKTPNTKKNQCSHLQMQ